MKAELKKMIEDQINFEYQSAYVYLGMQIFFENKGWKGFAHWMYKQYHEEIEHAERMTRFMLSVGEAPKLEALEAVTIDYPGVIAVFEAAYKHEREVTKAIDEIVTVAIKQKDYATENFFRTFVDEQVEEEDSVSEIVDRLKIAKDDAGFLVIDGQLAQR